MSSKPRIVDLRGGREVRPIAARDVKPREPRRSTLKEKKRRIRAVVTAGVCVCLLLSAYALHAASYLPRFTYQHVTVHAPVSIPKDEVQTLVENKLAESSRGYISGRNIFIYDFSQLESVLVAAFPKIKKARVSRDTTLANGLVVDIEERGAYALWCETSAHGCFFIDETGLLYAQAGIVSTSTQQSPYIFHGPLSTTTSAQFTNEPLGQSVAKGHFVGLVGLLKLLEVAGMHPLGVTVESDTDFFVPLAEGYYLKASYGEDPSVLVKNLALILGSPELSGKSALLQYIDLRFGNRVYYKLNEPSVPETKKSP